MGHDWPVHDQANVQANSRITADALAGLLTGWADAHHGTLSQQLAHALRRAVRSGVLGDGTRLPPERGLATALAVSRSTVTAALDELRADGTVTSRQGSGTVVRTEHPRALVGTRIAEHFATVPGVDLAAGNPPDASHLPPSPSMSPASSPGAGGPAWSPWASPPCARPWPPAWPATAA